MRVVLASACAALMLMATQAAESSAQSLAAAYATIESKQFVDLTHAFGPGIPHWKGFPAERVRTLYWYTPKKGTRGSGFFAQEFDHVGQWGTHVDPPAHFVPGGRTVDQIAAKEMILPLVVIDVHDQAARNPDYTLTLADVHTW